MRISDLLAISIPSELLQYVLSQYGKANHVCRLLFEYDLNRIEITVAKLPLFLNVRYLPSVVNLLNHIEAAYLVKFLLKNNSWLH
jgi:hypothetical protein